MAILKHNTSKNVFSAAVTYLTMQHDEKGALLRDPQGNPIPRQDCLINGIHCIPETFAPLCMEDRLRFHKAVDKRSVSTHQYILSFAPEDNEKGLCPEEAQRFGIDFAKRNFPGHRAVVCTHADGGQHAGNIHVHIVISSLRFADRAPDPQFMRLRSDGTVKPSEYKAGCCHQDTAALRKYLLAQTNEYCRQRGYAICPEKAKNKYSQEEYLAKSKGQETRNDQLRRAIADAAATTNQFAEFARRLQQDYTYKVPRYPPIPYPLRTKLWKEYRSLNEDFWSWSKQRRAAYKAELANAYQALKDPGRKADRPAISRQIDQLKENLAKERLYRSTFLDYAKAAKLALQSHNPEDAEMCLEQLRELTCRREGYWQEGWNPNAGTHSIQDGTVKSRITWKQITEEEVAHARKVRETVAEEAAIRKVASEEYQEVPMPIEVCIRRGEVQYRHPDSQRWVRGKRLGDAYTLKSLGIYPLRQRTVPERHRTPEREIAR